jgi:hypothetical protein
MTWVRPILNLTSSGHANASASLGRGRSSRGGGDRARGQGLSRGNFYNLEEGYEEDENEIQVIGTSREKSVRICHVNQISSAHILINLHC